MRWLDDFLKKSKKINEPPKIKTISKISNVDKINILIADDAYINRYVLIKFLYNFLKNDMIMIDEAIDGMSCIDKISNKIYDLIFLDIKMPKINGDKIALEISKMNLKTIVIGVTGQVEIKQKVLENGMDFCLIKPLEYHYLKNFLHTLIDDDFFI